ncbi:hypothetical protein [Breznakia pachnodae]|uniref:N-acetylmuramoyl-L-alanine amidase n=1 Tax=Breznakia pachnodae TaxID=265178 RepID=A0ABU0DZ45_9FIRM|nr:hypothetical protein [Breznakia pachnodae]MDQ0359721.1 N-acetylmuramoyl-L-alanine amidase [Breznakia pachnodae]
MAYTPRKRRFKLNYKIVVPLLVLLIFIAYFLVNFINKSNEEQQVLFTVCDFSSEKTKTTLEKEYKDVTEVKDYLFYGESLGIYQDPYKGENSDGFNAKTIKLKSVCGDEEYSFLMDSAADRKILLGNLEPGFYEMYIVEDLKERRLYMSDEVDISTTTVTRNGKNKKVQLLADTKLLNDYDVTTNYAYAYLSVSETKLKEDEYDVVIDPAANDSGITGGYGSTAGSSGNGLTEATESYIAAELLKTKLEEKGLKVLILRGEDEVISTYGEDGRIAKAYEVNAKYYFRLGFSSDETSPSLNGFNIFHSSHSTGMLASQIGYDLPKNTGKNLVGDTIHMRSGDSTQGVISSGVNAGDIDGREVYDSDLYIRESGGKATQAGMYSENSQEGTASFSKDNLYGINTLNIYFCYFSNSDNATYWKNSKETIVDSVANSIAVYLDLDTE